jgi:hypothetical protein
LVAVDGTAAQAAPGSAIDHATVVKSRPPEPPLWSADTKPPSQRDTVSGASRTIAGAGGFSGGRTTVRLAFA